MDANSICTKIVFVLMFDKTVQFFLVAMGKEKTSIAFHLANYANINHKNKIRFFLWWGVGMPKRITILHGGGSILFFFIT